MIPARALQIGEIYWIPVRDEAGVERPITHPHVIVQATTLNQTRITTTVACALSTNMRRASEPGNVLLEEGEGGLPKRSVVVVSQVSTVEKAWVGAYIGRLSAARLDQIFAGMRFLQSFQRR